MARLPAILLGALAAAACGDNLPQVHEFELVGHTDLGARGMNAALAVAGDIVYVGSRNDQHGVAIVDVSDPAAPVVVGELGPPDEHVPSMSSRELRVVPERNLLVVLNMICGLELHGCATSGGELENLKFYDITDRRAPRLVGRHDVFGTMRFPRGPHEFFLWHDATRVLVYIAAPPGGAGLRGPRHHRPEHAGDRLDVGPDHRRHRAARRRHHPALAQRLRRRPHRVPVAPERRPAPRRHLGPAGGHLAHPAGAGA